MTDFCPFLASLISLYSKMKLLGQLLSINMKLLYMQGYLFVVIGSHDECWDIWVSNLVD